MGCKVLNGWYVGAVVCGCVPGRMKIISDSAYGLKSPRNPQGIAIYKRRIMYIMYSLVCVSRPKHIHNIEIKRIMVRGCVWCVRCTPPNVYII